MQKKLQKAVILFCCVLYLLPISVLAAGNGFVASRNSDVFHIISCYHVNKIYDHNKIYFDTYQEAKNSGRRGCYSCNPSSWYDNSGASISSAKKDRSQYNSGFAAGRDAGYDDGYDIGFEKGYAQGKEDTLKNEVSAKVSKAQKETFWGTLALNYFFFRPIFMLFVDSFDSRNKKQDTYQPSVANEKKPKPLSPTTGPEISFIDYRDSVLIIIFRGGKEVHHYDVPVSAYNNLISSASKYEHYKNNIQDRYPKY